MPRPDRPRISLSLRIALLVFVGGACLLGGFAFTAFAISRGLARSAFDDVLRARAEALASLVEDDEHEDELELESAAEIAARFAGKRIPDLFAVTAADGRVVARSQSLADLPRPGTLDPGAAVFAELMHGGERYRGIRLAVERDSEERHGQGFVVQVFFAAATHELTARLDDLAGKLLWLTLTGLVICAALAGVVAWRGLAPLRRLADETHEIGGQNLDSRVTAARLPTEVHTVAAAVNGLLDRLGATLDHERRFSSDAAHELRTPVATLKASIQAALLDTADGKRDRETLEELLVDVERLADLCDALLLVASSRAASAASELSAEDWLGEIEAAFRGLTANGHAGSAHVRLVEPAAPPAGLVLATDRAAAGRIAVNLIQNALRHAGAEARIEIAIHWTATGARLTVEDDGPGVAPEHRERLFDRFYRADRARSRETGGAGLGLAICRALAEAGGGSIEFEAVEPHGARFVWEVTTSPRPAPAAR